MSDSKHITREDLEALDRDEIGYADLFFRMRAHLLESCPICRDAWEEYRLGLAAHRASRPSDEAYDLSFSRAVDVAASHAYRAGQERERAALFVESLRALDAGEQLDRIAELPEHQRTPALALALLAQSHEYKTVEPRLSLHWAQLAEHVVAESRDTPLDPGLWVLAVAMQGNALRVSGRPQPAAHEFDRARRLMTRHDVADPFVRAELASLHASNYIDLRMPQDARRALEEAATIFEALSDRPNCARILTKLADAHVLSEDYEAAVDATYRAVGLLDPGEHERLYLCARLTLARALTKQGKYEPARDTLDFEADRLARITDLPFKLNVLWLEGAIAEGLGELVRAEARYRDVRRGWITLRIGFDAAIASLDLAALLYRTRRRDEALTLAREAHQLARTHHLHEEALAALLLLTDALRDKVAAAALIEEVAAFLRTLKADPQAVFRPQSIDL